MAEHWHYSLNGQKPEIGSLDQLKQLVASGQLKPTDMVWCQGTENWRKASTVPELFPRDTDVPPPLPVQKKRLAEPAEKPVLQPLPDQPSAKGQTTANPQAGAKRTFTAVENPLGVFLILLTCFPLGLYYVWRHPSWAGKQKITWTGSWLAFFILLFFLPVVVQPVYLFISLFTGLIVIWIQGHWTKRKRWVATGAASIAFFACVFAVAFIHWKRDYSEANRSWTAGEKAEAVRFYKHHLVNANSLAQAADRPTMFERVIEYEIEQGNTASAKGFIDMAESQKVRLSLNEPRARELLAEVQKERADRVAAVAARKERERQEKIAAVELKKKQQQEIEAAEQQERIAAADLKKKERLEREAAEREREEKERQDRIAAAELKKKERLANEAAELAKKEAEEKAERDMAIVLSAETLSQEYRNNSVKADQQYKGKMLKVTGNVDSTSTGLFNKLYVYMKRVDAGKVECTFGESHKDQIAKLENGQRITVTGECTGGGGFGVNLRRCEFVQAPTVSVGKKMIAFKAIVEKFAKFPDRLAPLDERLKYTKELREVFNTYQAIPFDPKQNRDEAKAIIQLFETRISGKYSGQVYIEIEASVLVMVRELIE